MSSARRLFAPFPLAAVTAAAAMAAALALLPAPAHAASSTLCGEQTASVSAGAYNLQNNEYDSSASECVSTDGNADFQVANSGIANAANGSPGSYPSLFKGCHWGQCTSGSGLPVQVSSMGAGDVTSSWSTSRPGGANAYDVAYDVWYNQTAATSGQPNGAEVMVWLNHDGGVQPYGSLIASNVTIGGTSYNVWVGDQSTWDTISYTMNSPSTSAGDLDLDLIAQDAVNRGYIQRAWYLIDVEAGFELWQGGAGLATNSFSVSVNGSGSSPTPPPTSAPPTAPPTTAPPTAPPPTAPPTSPGGGSGSPGCSAAYSLVGSWPGGYQGQVVVTDTGSSPTTGWQLSWTYPDTQRINNLWNGTYTQTVNTCPSPAPLTTALSHPVAIRSPASPAPTSATPTIRPPPSPVRPTESPPTAPESHRPDIAARCGKSRSAAPTTRAGAAGSSPAAPASRGPDGWISNG